MIAEIHRIAIIVSKEQSLEFYRLLGFVETFRKKRRYDTVVRMEAHGIQLEIFIDANHCERSDDEPYGIRFFAFRVEHPLEDIMEQLRDSSNNRIQFGPIMTDWSGVRFVFTKDPDGLPIEFHE